jgi:hypothetical protein
MKESIKGKIKLKLRPHTQSTKNHMTKRNKNHLIMINTTAEKEIGVVLEYLSQKQCGVPIEKIVIRVQKGKLSFLNKQESWAKYLEGQP